MCKTILLIMLWVPQFALWAQHDTITLYKGLQARLHYGFIFAHSEAIQNTAGAHPRGIEFETIRQKADTSVWNICHCYPVKGWSLSYFDFNNRVLGRGLIGAYFLEPAYRIGNKGQFRFRGSVGFGYLTNPYNPQNQSVKYELQFAVKWFSSFGCCCNLPGCS